MSKKKRRIQDETPQGDIDLDFTAVHKNIVCMGLPAVGIESLYRNPYEQVKDYLDFRFGDGYMVYNLCSEEGHVYPADRFHGRVAYFPFPDHHACPLEMIPRFVTHALSFLAGGNDRVVAVHCKAGKGRTGLLACCLLMHLDPRLANASEAVAFYGRARTSDGRGLTIPSQIRYVEYYGELRRLNNGALPALIPSVSLSGITIRGFASVCTAVELVFGEAKSPAAVVEVKLTSSHLSDDKQTWTIDVTNIPACHRISGDVRINLKSSAGDKKWVGALSFHTLFIKRSYHIHEVDRLYKQSSEFPSDAAIVLEYVALPLS